MNQHFVDAFRAVVIWQSLMSGVLVIIGILMLLLVEEPRPGRLTGIIATGISNLTFLGFMAIETANDYGTPFCLQLVFASIGVYASGLGFSLLIAHMAFHSEKVTDWLKTQFIRPPRPPGSGD